MTYTEEGCHTKNGGRHTIYLYRRRVFTYSADVCGSSTRSILYCKSWTRGRRRTQKRKSNNFVHQQRCRQPRKVNYQIHWRSEQNAEYWILLSATQERILADSVYAIVVHQSMLEECVAKVVKKGDESCSQDNLCLERTRSNTPTFYAVLGTPRSNCRCGTSTQFHQRVAVGRTRNHRDKPVHADTDSLKGNILSEKAAKKIHEAGNCELHKTKFKQLIADAYLRFQERQRVVYEGVYTLSNNWKWQIAVNQNSDSQFHTKASLRIRRRACLGKPRSMNTYIWWLVEGKLVDHVLVREIKRTWRKSENILSKMVTEWWIFVSIFCSENPHCSRGSQSRSSNHCVCDRGVYTHSLVARTFFCCTYTARALRTFSYTITHGSRLQCACRHLSFISPLSLLMFRPSLLLLFLDGHFETNPDYDVTDFDIHDILPNFPRPKSATKKRRSSALRTRTSSLAAWPSSFLPQVMSPKSSTRSLPWIMTRRSSTNQTTVSPTSRKNHEREQWSIRCFHSVWILCFARCSLVILFLREKAKKACNRETVAREREREREEREDFVISVAESMSMKSRRNSKRSHSLQTHKEFCSDDWHLRGHQEWKSSTSYPWWKFSSEKIKLGWVRIGEPKFLEWRNSEHSLFESQRELESQRLQLLQDIYWTDQVQRERKICVANWIWRIVFIRKASQEVAKNLKNWKCAAFKRKNMENKRRLE